MHYKNNSVLSRENSEILIIRPEPSRYALDIFDPMYYLGNLSHMAGVILSGIMPYQYRLYFASPKIDVKAAISKNRDFRQFMVCLINFYNFFVFLVASEFVYSKNYTHTHARTKKYNHVSVSSSKKRMNSSRVSMFIRVLSIFPTSSSLSKLIRLRNFLRFPTFFCFGLSISPTLALFLLCSFRLFFEIFAFTVFSSL